MTPQQLAGLLVGIARSQAAVLTAVERVDSKPSSNSIRQAAQQILHASLFRAGERRPATLQNLPQKLLDGALAPGSSADKDLEKTALADVTRLLA